MRYLAAEFNRSSAELRAVRDRGAMTAFGVNVTTSQDEANLIARVTRKRYPGCQVRVFRRAIKADRLDVLVWVVVRRGRQRPEVCVRNNESNHHA